MHYKSLYTIIAFFNFSLCNAQVNKQSMEDGINNRFSLLNAKNFEEVFKGEKPVWYEDYQLGTVAFIFNKTKSQVLELIAAEGWGKYDFIAFNLHSIPSSFAKKGIILEGVDSFCSNQGFYIDMEYNKDLKQFKSYKKKIVNKENFVLYKDVNLGMNYFQKLFFENNRLYRIYFGYDSP